jgi:hypothetical protein
MGIDISPMPVRHGQTPARRLHLPGKPFTTKSQNDFRHLTLNPLPVRGGEEKLGVFVSSGFIRFLRDKWWLICQFCPFTLFPPQIPFSGGEIS